MDPDSRPNLLILGASTRAAAFSALRGGWRPICLDQFADSDLRARAVAQRIEDYPQGLIEAMQAMPACPAVYVGGLENHPEVIRAARELHRLWGNDEEVLARARDPAAIEEALGLVRANVPEWRPQEDPPARDGTWVVRPQKGTGGRGIHVWSQEAAAVPTLSEPHRFQRRIEGIPYSAVFIAPETVGDVRFVGITRQLIGEGAPQPGEVAGTFRWHGNVGPVTLSVGVENAVRRVGNVLKWKLGLKGIFGVDFVVDADEVDWVTEINPRYPASAELLEFATGLSMLAEHCRCFAADEVPPATEEIVVPQAPFLGKAIFFSPRTLSVRKPLGEVESNRLDQFPAIADLPALGQRFRRGEPVCTVFATGETIDQCRNGLRQRLAAVEAGLG